MGQLVSYTYTHWRARTHAYRHARMHTCVHVYMHTYTPPYKKPKSPTETAKKLTPHRDFKSFRSSGRQREMGILSNPSARAI